MQKIKILTAIMLYGLMTAWLSVPVVAFAPEIVTLPSYVTTNSFWLSCTASGTNAQFMYKKEGGSWASLGPAIALGSNQCQVQVASTQVDEQTGYYFKVNVDGTDSAETTTFYDISGPSGVSNYYKEQVGTGFYKLHWRNPGDSDFSQVVIYRGDTADFSSDSSHEIARVAGGANSDMTYDEHQPDSNKTYYYAIRALDKAGNSSSLVGDISTITATASPSAGSSAGTAAVAGGESSSVNVLPAEEGQVLGDESVISTPGAISVEDTTGESGGLTTAQKIGIGLGVLALGVGAYFFAKRKKS